VVSVGNTAFMRYSRIFKRKDNVVKMKIPVAYITDNDLNPSTSPTDQQLQENQTRKYELYSGQTVKGFISPNWTLEYDLCLNKEINRLFYTAVLYAEKEKNSNKYGLTEKKTEEVNKKVTNDFDSWISSNETLQSIAYKIYNDYMLQKDISKAIVAQYFAHLLWESKDKVKSIIENPNSSFKYLVDAIKHVTPKL
jgi:putative ATP-dependent endonuclease of OLD family